MSVPLFPAEADHFSKRYERIEDSRNVINFRINKSIKKVLNDLNIEKNCDLSHKQEVELYKKLQIYFANHKSGKVIQSILHQDDFPKLVIPLKNSIYKKWGKRNGFLLGRKKAVKSPLALAPLLNINGNIIGTDKIEHLFGMGFRYFKDHYLRGKKIKTVLSKGVLKEKTVLGGHFFATGVFSYADLSANFNGMRFWNHMLGKRKDFLSQNLGPYIICTNNKWVQNEEVDISNYIDPSMDESINCSKFATRGGVKKFKARVNSLGFSCPMNEKLLDEMLSKYDQKLCAKASCSENLSQWILNLKGNEKVSYFNEIK